MGCRGRNCHTRTQAKSKETCPMAASLLKQQRNRFFYNKPFGVLLAFPGSVRSARGPDRTLTQGIGFVQFLVPLFDYQYLKRVCLIVKAGACPTVCHSEIVQHPSPLCVLCKHVCV